MSYIDQRLLDCIAYGISGGPEYKTTVVKMDNGRELRNGEWLYPLHRYSVPLSSFGQPVADALLEAFHATRGQLHAFRFRDPADNQATQEPLAPAVGTSTPVQLAKTYTRAGISTTRLIQAPRDAVVRRNGVAVAGTLNTGTGMFTPSAPWASGTYDWTGPFDVWVRFASDWNTLQVVARGIYTADVELVEVRR
jgi:uncharacterized protein (TIGR02217 family)